MAGGYEPGGEGRPVAQEAVVPVAQDTVAPVGQDAVAPVLQEPAAQDAAASTAPVGQDAVAPVLQEPVAPGGGVAPAQSVAAAEFDDAGGEFDPETIELIAQIRQLAAEDPHGVQQIIAEVLAALDRVTGAAPREP